MLKAHDKRADPPDNFRVGDEVIVDCSVRIDCGRVGVIVAIKDASIPTIFDVRFPDGDINWYRLYLACDLRRSPVQLFLDGAMEVNQDAESLR